MSDYAIDAFYLGSAAEWDTFDDNWSVAQAFSLVGKTFGSGAAPLFGTYERLLLEGAGRPDGVGQDASLQSLHPLIVEQAADPLDGALEYHVTIHMFDGLSVAAKMYILQDDLGRLFLTTGYGPTGIRAQSVRSITIGRLAGDNLNWLCSDLETSAFVTSFLEGTRLMVSGGEIPVEQLQIGDQIQTLDHGLQPIVWMGCQHVVSGTDEVPIRIAAGALGMGWPKRPLYVSPQHRVLIASSLAQQMFDQAQVLVPAKKLLGLPGISQKAVHQALTYWHVMTRAHEVVFAESALVESFLPGPMALSALPERNRRDLYKHQPSLVFQEGKPQTARRCVEGARAEILVDRMSRLKRPLLEAACLSRAASTGSWAAQARTRRAAAVRCRADVAGAYAVQDVPCTTAETWAETWGASNLSVLPPRQN